MDKQELYSVYYHAESGSAFVDLDDKFPNESNIDAAFVNLVIGGLSKDEAERLKIKFIKNMEG